MDIMDSLDLPAAWIARVDQGWTIRVANAGERPKAIAWCDFAQREICVADDCPPDQRRGAVLHEIAHAVMGPQAGHGRLWMAYATAIGATVRCGAMR